MTHKRAGNLKRILSWIGAVLIIAGVSLALFPFLENAYYRYFVLGQQKASTAWYWEDKPDELSYVMLIEDHVKVIPERFPDKLIADEGFLTIPDIELSLAVGYGIEDADLRTGPSFYPQSGYPDTGNVSIAGHRNAYGSPFWHLDKLTNGDEIYLTYRGKNYIYQVDEVYITNSTDWSVIDPTPTPALTLTTCDPVIRPRDGEYDRLIVRAYLIEANKN
ncbi:MAG: hypothetical protein APF76_13570 [Desulfitibacter sp. BRH_c19]|nr:MAG: hypothetical protein APF76_13570 [Desulfitibacter sp. BRH_c19]